jgi:hypothetical protein
VLDSEPKAVKRLDQVLVETAMHARTCEKLADGPWFVQACFVGPWARVDILELRYRRLFTTIQCSWRDISLLYDLATVDAYHTGLKPMLFVRHLVLQWDMGRDSGKARRDPKYWPQATEQPSWEACFEALRQVRCKSYFRFDIQIAESGAKRSGEHFRHLLETFRPVYEEFTAAGANITITRQHPPKGRERISLNVTPFFTMDKDVWYEQFLAHCIESDLIVRRQVADMDGDQREITVDDVQDWHVEADKEFDDMFEQGVIKYL